MQFESERQLQDYCLAVLRSKGITAQEEVWCGSLRADIVTDRAVMELKKVLDRNALYQALGQALTYQRSLNKAEVWIVGQSPTDPSDRATATNVAREIETRTIKVSFVESDPFWRVAPVEIPASFGRFNRLSLSRRIVLILGMVTIAFISGAFGLNRNRAGFAQRVNVIAPIASSAASTPIQQSAAVPLPTAAPSDPLVSIQDQALRIGFCNGQPAGANLRQFPGWSASPILNTIAPGETVYLTGRIAYSDQGNWYEAIALEQSAQQVGWIAACFVTGVL